MRLQKTYSMNGEIYHDLNVYKKFGQIAVADPQLEGLWALGKNDMLPQPLRDRNIYPTFRTDNDTAALRFLKEHGWAHDTGATVKIEGIIYHLWQVDRPIIDRED